MDELEQLESRHRVEQSKLNELITVGQAENVVSTARQDELQEQQRAAHCRLAAARGLLTKAQRDGSAERIAAARARVDAASTEFDRICDQAIAEMLQISRAGLDRLGAQLEQMRTTWDASSAVIDELRRGRSKRS